MEETLNFEFLKDLGRHFHSEREREWIERLYGHCANAEKCVRYGLDPGNYSRHAIETMLKFLVEKRAPQTDVHKLNNPALEKDEAVAEFLFSGIANAIYDYLYSDHPAKSRFYDLVTSVIKGENNEASHFGGPGYETIGTGDRNMRLLRVVAVAFCVHLGVLPELYAYRTPRGFLSSCYDRIRAFFSGNGSLSPTDRGRRVRLSDILEQTPEGIRLTNETPHPAFELSYVENESERPSRKLEADWRVSGEKWRSEQERFEIRMRYACAWYEEGVLKRGYNGGYDTNNRDVPEASTFTLFDVGEKPHIVCLLINPVTKTIVGKRTWGREEPAVSGSVELPSPDLSMEAWETDLWERMRIAKRHRIAAACIAVAALAIAFTAAIKPLFRDASAEAVPRVEYPVEVADVLSRPSSPAYQFVPAEEPPFILSVLGVVLHTEDAYCFLQDTPIDIQIPRPERVKQVYYQLGEGSRQRFIGTSLTLPEDSADAGPVPLYVYAELDDGTWTSRNTYYRISLCRDIASADKAFLVCANGKALSETEPLVLPSGEHCLVVQQRGGNELAEIFCDFGSGTQTIPADGGCCLLYTPEEGDFTLKLKARLANGEETGVSTYPLSIKPVSEAAELLPEIEVSIGGHILSADKVYIIDDPTVKLAIADGADVQRVYYKIGLSDMQYIQGGSGCSVEIPARFANTGGFSFYVSYTTSDGTQKPWVLYELDYRTLPDPKVQSNGVVFSSNNAYVLDAGDVLTVSVDGVEAKALSWAFGEGEDVFRAEGGGPWEIEIPRDLADAGQVYFRVSYDTVDGKSSVWLTYTLNIQRD